VGFDDERAGAIPKARGKKMSRLVRAEADAGGLVSFGGGPVSVAVGSPGAPNVAGASGTTQVDNYAARMVKYIPAEVIAFFLAADKLFAPTFGTAAPSSGSPVSGTPLVTGFINSHGLYLATAIFFVALLATPLYMWKQSEKNQPWSVNAFMSTVAFVIWSYATQGAVFYGNGLYDARIGSLLILVYTLLSGFVIPSQGKSSAQGGLEPKA